MQREVPFKAQKDWRVVRYTLGGIISFAVLTQLLTYLSLVALADRPHIAAVAAAGLVSLLLGTPLIVLAAVQSRRAERFRNQVNHVVSRDSTTGCITARGLVQHVDRLERRHRRSGDALQGALIHVRINNLDEMAGSFGPQWGDELLQFVASTITTSVRRDDIVARTGPASFDVLLAGASESDANEVCVRLSKALAASHFAADGKTVDLALSVGGVLFEGSIDLERLHRLAASQTVVIAEESASSPELARLPSA
ncbi:diguanylate cyclase/phosphodiesterase (GGDEF & EAL domains) with PAS/PAC sensor(s) (plasmid) [Sinorhizobium sojae CCBAU 05684]|uniref:Diguanylate cyclase/phosphodiesterase (GGDEF & EAL domains) with PAS/PAC sensor(S) n=1 Tax=Sinorhizobium sojae CCBAU 05684 TaxID=716928 RepID=A0A249PJC9_9HYPH|nr:diguanylate cyclase [Sinorhizobium sojae]ASY65847.1 diguanylate cyclase/phosphodiesterase (GGDEF & EAL domains) with PAS/PAC sensor(s) [Sinorhizobium sojae CCBAU 05684]